MVEKDTPWRKAEKIHPWSRETDPSSLAGDEWVGEGDPGVEKAVTPTNVIENSNRPVMERFMHPQHDVES